LRRQLRNNEDAVSAAVATVLLFAIVLSIISGMMAMIVPTMAELQGAVDRESMEGQFTDLAQETVRLSETGLPGDIAEMKIRPHTGDIGWDIRKEGTWYTASLYENQSLRLKGLNDLDSSFQHRYPSGEVSSACLTDLRAHSQALNIHESPALNGTLLLTPMSNLQQPLESTIVSHDENKYRINTGEIFSVESSNIEPAITKSSNTMRALFVQGESGIATYSPDSPSPHAEGRAWTIPLPAGEVEFVLYSEESFVSTMKINDEFSSYTSTTLSSQGPLGSSGRISTTTFSYDFSSEEVATITSTADARLIILRSGTTDQGTSALLDWTGSTIGTEFLVPSVSEDIIIHNPGLQTSAVLLNGFYHSVGARESLRLSIDSIGGWITSNQEVEVHLVRGGSEDSIVNGIDTLHPTSTGRTSGSSWENIISGSNMKTSLVFQRLGIDASISYVDNIENTNSISLSLNESTYFSSVEWSSSEGGRLVIDSERQIGQGETPIRTFISFGDSGITEIQEKGNERCIGFSDRITGWVQNDLPWRDVSFMADAAIEDSWKNGEHPAGVRIEFRGPTDRGTNSAIALGWSIPLPRMDYSFSSSVSGLELGWRGGYVGTNHPEYSPEAILTPPSREGPGPRVAVTVPVVYPDLDIVTGNSDHDVTITLDSRFQLASISAHEVRRGWDGPYGEAVASQDAIDLDQSVDWLIYPGRLDLLNDYVGWVQPTPTSAESIYHAGGDHISFNLQIAIIDYQTEVI
tara:strand:+ start:12098 stop:14341 length:2244 start_codon:yes stop_codon:yes gene_type:complete